jgi:hypothetical protein
MWMHAVDGMEWNACVGMQAGQATAGLTKILSCGQFKKASLI